MPSLPPPTLPKKFVAIDTETTGLVPWTSQRNPIPARVFAIALTFPNGKRMYHIDRDGTFPNTLPITIKRIISDPSIDKVFHNAKFDTRMIETTVKSRTVRGQIWDTMIFAHLLDGSQRLNLDSLSHKYVPQEKQKVVRELNDWFDDHSISPQKRGEHFVDLPDDIIHARCAGDADLTLSLFMRMYTTVAQTFPFLLQQEHELLPIIRDMEDTGITLDIDEAERQACEFEDIVDDVRDHIEGVLGRDDFNLSSHATQCEVLEKAGLLNTIRDLPDKAGLTPTGRPKLSDYNLRNLHHPVSAMMLLGKASQKMASTFLRGMIERADPNSIVHPSFNQVGTRTGRLSSSNPNLQNIPVENPRRAEYTAAEADEEYELTGYRYAQHIKRIFVCRPNMAHIHSDKTRAEICMLAHYSQDATLVEILKDPNADVHDEVCMRLFGERTKGLRTRAKRAVFGYLYGAGDKTLASKIGGSLTAAVDTRKRLERILRGLPRWKAKLYSEIDARGYVQTIHGRRHYTRRDKSYTAINSMCQGTVGDEIKSRMVAIGKWAASQRSEGHDVHLLLQIHDDLCTQIPASPPSLTKRLTREIRDLMFETSLPYALPLPASLDITYDHWSNLKEVAL